MDEQILRLLHNIPQKWEGSGGELRFTLNDRNFALYTHPHLEWYENYFVLQDIDNYMMISEEIHTIEQLFYFLNEMSNGKSKETEKEQKI